MDCSLVGLDEKPRRRRRFFCMCLFGNSDTLLSLGFIAGVCVTQSNLCLTKFIT